MPLSERRSSIRTTTDFARFTAQQYAQAMNGIAYGRNYDLGNVVDQWARQVYLLADSGVPGVSESIVAAGQRTEREPYPRLDRAYGYTVESTVARLGYFATPLATGGTLTDGTTFQLVALQKRGVDTSPPIPVLIPIVCEDQFEHVRPIMIEYLKNLTETHRLFMETTIRISLESRQPATIPNFEERWPLWGFLQALPNAFDWYQQLGRFRDPHAGTLLRSMPFSPYWFLAMKEGRDQTRDVLYNSPLDSRARMFSASVSLELPAGAPVELMRTEQDSRLTIGELVLGVDGSPAALKRPANIMEVIDTAMFELLNANMGTLERMGTVVQIGDPARTMIQYAANMNNAWTAMVYNGYIQMAETIMQRNVGGS